MKNLEIKLTKCILILEEKELIECLALKPEIFNKAVGRGKGKIRAESSRSRELKRNAENFDRWQLYEILKANVITDNETIKWIEGMDKNELKEAIIEFLLARNRYIS